MNRSVLIAIVLSIISIAWVLSGSLSSGDQDLSLENDQPDAQIEDKLFKVKVEPRTAVKVLDRVDLQGQIKAKREIAIRAKADGTVESLLVEKGQLVKQGSSLVKLSLDDRVARLERAKAELKVAQLELESGFSLKQKKLISENQHQQNLAAVTSAKAQVKEIETEIEHTHVTAPFNGVIDGLPVELGDYVAQGSELAKLVDKSQLEVSVQVPQQHIAKIELGQKVEAELLDGSKLEGHVTFVATSADTATRSFTVEALAENSASIKHFGQSARVSLIVGEQWAHKLSPALLSLKGNGELQVFSVDTNDMVVAHTVELIRSENDGVWLAGLPQTLNLIVLGQGFVAEGEKVEVLVEGDEKEVSLDEQANQGDAR